MGCVRLAKDPGEAKPIKGITAAGGPVARFGAFQAQAEMPVTFEMQFEVGFAGLVADVAPLRAVLSEDLTVTSELKGLVTFSRVVRSGRKLWEKAPEQVMAPGSKLISGWQGVTDAVFTLKIRGASFTLLEDTMHNLNTLDDLELLKMNRTYCKDHLCKDEKTGEVKWDRVCKNCKGVLRLRFQAPQRFAERKSQLERLPVADLAQRALLCGLQDEVTDAEKKKECINFIIKSEGIIR